QLKATPFLRTTKPFAHKSSSVLTIQTTKWNRADVTSTSTNLALMTTSITPSASKTPERHLRLTSASTMYSTTASTLLQFELLPQATITKWIAWKISSTGSSTKSCCRRY